MRLTYIEHPFLIDQISKDGKHMDCKEQTGNYGKDLIEEAIEKLWEYENLGEPNTIEALQQDNEQLQAECNAWKQSAEIAEKLALDAQAQNGAMVEALKQARETLETLNYLGGLGYGKHRWIDKALAAINKVIGGREDE